MPKRNDWQVEKSIRARQRLQNKCQLALDVGCGSGQVTDMLSPYFTNVIGIDISEAQIEEANRTNRTSNVIFR